MAITNGSKGSRLLVLSCSRRKRPFRSGAPAIDVYDGPSFQALRRVLRSAQFDRVVVRIVSAKYGLLTPDRMIRPYDRRLDPQRDTALLVDVRRALARLARTKRVREVFTTMGADYLLALPPAWSRRRAPRVQFASGPPGARVRQMLDWLGV